MTVYLWIDFESIKYSFFFFLFAGFLYIFVRLLYILNDNNIVILSVELCFYQHFIWLYSCHVCVLYFFVWTFLSSCDVYARGCSMYLFLSSSKIFNCFIFSILDILKKNYLLWDELNFKYEKFFKMEFYFFVCELFIDVLLFVIGENKQIF